MYTVYGKAEQELYEIHQPTCCGGLVVNCCDKGGGGCCKVPFYIYPPSGGEDARVGKLVKIYGGIRKEVRCSARPEPVHSPRSRARAPESRAHQPPRATPPRRPTQCCTLATNFEVEFPKDATQEHVALLYGASLLIDHNFFEGSSK